MSQRNLVAELHAKALSVAERASRGYERKVLTLGLAQSIYAQAAALDERALAATTDDQNEEREAIGSSWCRLLFLAGDPEKAKSIASQMLDDPAVTNPTVRAALRKLLATDASEARAR